MSISPGTRLGPYEVLGPLGAGGMGEVYRARDTRLSREVAIKVLPRELAADQDRLRRFEKEAQSASSLNRRNAQRGSLRDRCLRLTDVFRQPPLTANECQRSFFADWRISNLDCPILWTLSGQRHDLRLEELAVTGQQRCLVSQARRGDDLIGRIASEVEAPQGPHDGQRQRPDVDAGQEPVELRVVEVKFDKSELGKLGEFPQNDGGDAPTGRTQNPIFTRRHLARHGVDQEVGVKIDHAT